MAFHGLTSLKTTNHARNVHFFNDLETLTLLNETIFQRDLNNDFARKGHFFNKLETMTLLKKAIFKRA